MSIMWKNNADHPCTALQHPHHPPQTSQHDNEPLDFDGVHFFIDRHNDFTEEQRTKYQTEGQRTKEQRRRTLKVFDNRKVH